MCSVRNVIASLGNNWTFLTMLIIGEQGDLRFNELYRLIPDVSSRVLSSTLWPLQIPMQESHFSRLSSAHGVDADKHKERDDPPQVLLIVCLLI